MSTSRFSSRERERLCISSSSALRCSATSPEPGFGQGLTRRGFARQVLGLPRQGPRFDRVGAGVGALPSQLLLDVGQLLPQHEAGRERKRADREKKVERASRHHDTGGRRYRGCGSAASETSSAGTALPTRDWFEGSELIQTILGPRPRPPRRAVTRKQHRIRRAGRPARSADAWPRPEPRASPGLAARTRKWAMACELLSSQTPSVAPERASAWPCVEVGDAADVRNDGVHARAGARQLIGQPVAAGSLARCVATAHDQHRIIGPHLPRHLPPQRLRIELHRLRRRCIDEGRSYTGFEQGVAGSGAGGPGTGLRRPTRLAGSLRRRIAARHCR